jgi:radical SAM protein (TIGR01212 family)
MEDEDFPFFRYSAYLQRLYGHPAYRIGVDAGFSCPNRDSNRAGGCSYCDEKGSRASYTRSPDIKSLGDQIRRGRDFLTERYKAQTFLLYFQAFSSTFAPVPKLKEIYDFGLSLGDFRELIVSTRPDCVDEGVASLLGSYRERGFDVWVELGLQSVHDRTLMRINRGHSAERFFEAYRILKSAGIKVGVHLIFGLPGEAKEDCLESVRRVALCQPDGVKIHNLNIQQGTPLAAEYRAGELSVLSAARHIEYAAQALEMLPAETVILRLTCDTPRKRLVAPRNFPTKDIFYLELARYMKKRGMRQGRLFGLQCTEDCGFYL